jgi:thioredoxin-like negative regulator of GroEL
LAPTWDQLRNIYKSHQLINIGKVDCTKFDDLCSKWGIKGYPTLLLFENRMVIDKYKKERTLSNLMEFVENQVGEEEDDNDKLQDVMMSIC